MPAATRLMANIDGINTLNGFCARKQFHWALVVCNQFLIGHSVSSHTVQTLFTSQLLRAFFLLFPIEIRYCYCLCVHNIPD